MKNLRSFEIVEHTADLRLVLSSSSYQGLFEAGILGLSQLLKKDFCQNCLSLPVKQKVKVFSKDKTGLLIEFLSRVLTLSQINQVVFCKVVFDRLTKDSLCALIEGKRVESFDRDVKAVSYHEAEIKEDKLGRFTTSIVFDI